jgi:hypothetical protein
VREQVTKDKLWPNPIVTKLLPLATDGPAQFWSAEVSPHTPVRACSLVASIG